MGGLVNYSIEVTAVELSLIGEALDQLPYGKVSALVAKVQKQIFAQETEALKKAQEDKVRNEDALREQGRKEAREKSAEKQKRQKSERPKPRKAANSKTQPALTN